MFLNSAVWLSMQKSWDQATGWHQCFGFSSVLQHCWLDDRKEIWPVKPVLLISKGSLLEQWRKKIEGDRVNHVCLKKWVLKWMCILFICTLAVKIQVRHCDGPLTLNLCNGGPSERLASTALSSQFDDMKGIQAVKTPAVQPQMHSVKGKGENYQVCSVQYCVQQLCTVRCTHIWTD